MSTPADLCGEGEVYMMQQGLRKSWAVLISRPMPHELCPGKRTKRREGGQGGEKNTRN